MKLKDFIFENIFHKTERLYAANDGDEYCPRCDANLRLQKGYDNELPFWVCLGCGEMLINPQIESESDIVWLCDKCGQMLNLQEGFSEEEDSWKCLKCGFINKIDESRVYLSQDEKISTENDPYLGMSDDDIISIMSFETIKNIKGHKNISLVKDENNHLYIKKILDIYDESIYKYLLENPISNMPRIYNLYRGLKKLIVIEEYIEGKSLLEIMEKGRLEEKEAIRIVRDLSMILKKLHEAKTPIIHRDIKPSNVILDKDLRVYLLDINVAKWYKPQKNEDTRMLGTKYFAAPEQAGYGLKSSTVKADIYGIGVLLNVLVAQDIPKEKKAPPKIWKIVEKCIDLNPDARLTDDELIKLLNLYLEDENEGYTNK